MACYACAWYAQLCGGWNPVRLLLLVQLAFVFLGSSSAIAKSDSAYYNYEALSSKHLTEDQITHEFNTNELNGAVFSRRRRDAEENSRLELQNENQSMDRLNNGLADNMKKIRSETHQYYNSTIANDKNVADHFWVDMDNNSYSPVVEFINQNKTPGFNLTLKFDFPFYGFKIRNITILEAGFLFTGPHVHNMLNRTQYIAPLMANFNSSLSKDSRISYFDNGTALTVEWEDLFLQNNPKVGPFKFQVTIHENGDIIYVYREIPRVSMSTLEENWGPIKIGTSDAFIINSKIFDTPRITIYEYHRITFKFEEIGNGTYIYLKALPTCLTMENCHDCLTKAPQMNCKWCPALQKCDSSASRIQQEWRKHGCDQSSIKEANSCAAPQLISPKKNSKYESSPNKVRRSIDADAKEEKSMDQTIKSDGKVLHEDIYQRDNATRAAESSHYYNATISNEKEITQTFWVDMNNHPNRQIYKPSFKHFQVDLRPVPLKFDFPFYGGKIREVAITNGGFLSTGHYYLYSIRTTEYIAPLQAEFTTKLSNDSRITYADNGTAFTVEWENVLIEGRPELGPFSFQATLYDNGDIVFVYTKIPGPVNNIADGSIPNMVGLSDAYIADKIVFFRPLETINEYNHVVIKRDEIKNGTTIYFKALPTCLAIDNCNDCLTKVPNFDCKWCPALQQCSTGVARNRKEWLNSGCENTSIKELNSCPVASASTSSGSDVTSATQPSTEEQESHTSDPKELVLSRKRRFLLKEEPAATHDPMSDTPEIKTAVASVNVTYSTDKVTAVSSTMNPADKSPHLADANSTVKIETPKTSKNKTVVVSNPMNPVTGQPDEKSDDLVYAVPQVHVWANQTRWENATHKPDMKNPEKPDPPKPNPPTMSSEEKPKVNGTPNAKSNNTTSTDKVVVSTANSTDSDLGDISISKFSDVTNNTLAQNNITKTEEDTHQYYNSTFFSDENIAKSYWVDMDNHPDRQVNDLLSESHRRAATVKLKFDFPFYGHKVRNITIATGGFLYTGEYVHSWLAATQYIAPLMANFDTRLSRSSWVKYADNGTAFTVEWEEVVLQDRPEAGGFTFQATLHDNGNIVFVYSKIPLTVEAIEDTAHPVKVGLSDAYIMDRTIFFVRRKTIYEYHRVNFNHQEIRNWTVIYLKALPTCLELTNCTDCLTKVPEFECKWCPELQQCSTGTFRFRQDWLEKGCEQKNIKEPNSCPATQTSYTEHLDNGDHPGHARNDAGLSASVDQNSIRAKGASPSILEHPSSEMNMGVSGIIGILVVVTLIAGLVAWAGYAYRNPHSASGQMLIRYRPSQWSWRRGEARYTAATIHM